MKILIFNPFGIGDVLFTTPLIRNLKNNLPEAEIFYLSNKRVYPFMERNKLLNKVFIFEKDEWRQSLKESKFSFLKRLFSFFKVIKKEKFDLMFDLSLNLQYGGFFKLAGIKKRIGFNFKNRGRFLTHKKELPSGYKDKHVADYYLELLEFLNIEPERFQLELFLNENDLKKAEKRLTDLGISKEDLLIGICPGSGDSWQDSAYYKRWPKNSFSRLCNFFYDELGAKVIIFGSKTESGLGDFILDSLKYKPVNLCGKTGLVDFAAFLSFCDLFITNDGGPFHIAQALSINTVGLFGPVDDLVYGRYFCQDKVVVLKNKNALQCQPCYQKFKFKGCDYDKACLREIGVEEVFEAAKRLIAKAK